MDCSPPGLPVLHRLWPASSIRLWPSSGQGWVWWSPCSVPCRPCWKLVCVLLRGIQVLASPLVGQRCEVWNKGEKAGLFWYLFLSLSCLRIAAWPRGWASPPSPALLSQLFSWLAPLLSKRQSPPLLGWSGGSCSGGLREVAVTFSGPLLSVREVCGIWPQWTESPR